MDDDNLKQAMIQLAQAGNVSLTSFFESFGMEFDKELEKMKEDAVAKAINTQETEFEVQQAKFLNSKTLGDKLEDSSDYKKTLADSQGLASNLYGADPGIRQAALTQTKIADFPTYSMTKDMLEEYDQTSQAAAGTGPGEASSGGKDENGEPKGPEAASPALEQAMANENNKSQIAINSDGGEQQGSKPPAKSSSTPKAQVKDSKK